MNKPFFSLVQSSRKKISHSHASYSSVRDFFITTFDVKIRKMVKISTAEKYRRVRKSATYSSEELVLNSDRSSSAEELEEFPYSSGESPENSASAARSSGEIRPENSDGDNVFSSKNEFLSEYGNKTQTLSLIGQCSNSENLLKCFFCDTHTNVATSRDAYLEHLKKTHRFIIANDHLIADFKRYIDYWRAKFDQKNLTDFCSIIKTPMFPEDHGVPTMYLLLGDIPQDRKLREALQQKRLRLVLEQNQLER